MHYRILSADPGTDTLGVAVLDYDPVSGKLHVVFTSTYTARYQTRHVQIDNQSTRWQNLRYHRRNMIALFKQYQPNCFVIEAPFFRRFVAAYEALVECRAFLYSAYRTYTLTGLFFQYPPMEIKKSVATAKVKGAEAKTVVKISLLAADDVVWGDIDPETLSEHEIDAVAAGLHHMRKMKVISDG